MAQAVHAAIQLSQDQPDMVSAWHRDSNYLVIVSVADMHELMKLSSSALQRGLKISLAIEPDRADELCAVAIQPGNEARRLCANLPLALRCPKGCVCEHCDPLAYHYERKVMANG